MPPAMVPLFRMSARWLLWLAVIVAYGAAILPAPEAPAIWSWDKANHMAAFVVVTVLARIGYPRARIATILLPIIGFGGLIELTQALPMIHRDAEWADWGADIVASLIGMGVAWPLSAAIGRFER